MHLAAAIALTIVTFPAAARPQAPDPEVLVGSGEHRYAWVSGWAGIPDPLKLGNTHGCIVVDHKGRIYVNTDTERAVVVLAPSGELLGAWGKDLGHGLHGMALVREGDDEFLYLAHTGRHEVLKTTLGGEVQWRLGWPKSSKLYETEEQFRPTSVAVAPDGRLFVADGYGRSYVHRFDAGRRYLGSFGGRGTEPGKMRTPHGLFVDTRGDDPQLIVCDRENHRLQVFDLEGRLLRVVEGMLRRPCNVQRHGDWLAVADLAGRVTILDRKNDLVTHLGDNPDPRKRAKNGVPPDDWKDGEFLAPHSACFDAAGNLYVMDWNATGRITKLIRR